MFSNATGLWDVSDYGSTPVFTAGQPGSIFLLPEDRPKLERLAFEVRELSGRDIEAEKKKDWILHNDLKSKKPLVFCDPENGWNEIITSGDLTCRGVLARKWEMALRKEIFWATEIADDKVIEPFFNIGHTYRNSGWGPETEFRGGKGGSYTWESALAGNADLEKLVFPRIDIDLASTSQTLELANEVLGKYLEVRLRGVWWWTLGLTMTLAFLVGLEKMMVAMYDNPEFIHKIMKFLGDGTMEMLESLQTRELLTLNNDCYVGSGGFGYTSHLPQADFKGPQARLCDIWGFAESQETTGISPSMFEEFVFQYQLPILELFGLNCYGCCEPLEKRWHILKNIPNLRRVSVSSWSDFALMAENLQDKYIYSLKAKPTDVAQPVIDEEASRKRLRGTLEQCPGCFMEIILKDTHTLGGNPANITRWVEIAREEAQRYYGKQ